MMDSAPEDGAIPQPGFHARALCLCGTTLI